MKRVVFSLLAVGSLAGLLLASADLPGDRPTARAAGRAGIHKIRHVVIIMQENRSFDSYFGNELLQGPFRRPSVLVHAGRPANRRTTPGPTYLLYRYHVSWSYYVDRGTQPDCANDKMFCAPVPRRLPQVHRG